MSIFLHKMVSFTISKANFKQIKVDLWLVTTTFIQKYRLRTYTNDYFRQIKSNNDNWLLRLDKNYVYSTTTYDWF